MKQKQVIILVIVILLLTGGAYWYANRAPSTVGRPGESNSGQKNANNRSNDTTPVEAPAPDPTPSGDQNSISIAGQRAGKTVIVDALALNKPGFVAIHEIVNGTPGKIIGISGIINAGAGTDLIVNTTTIAGKSYIAMLHIDNGNKKFDATEDDAALNLKGQIAMQQFTAN